MGFGSKNNRKRPDALACAKARGGSEAVLLPKPTEGAANSGHISPVDPRKPKGLLAVARKNLISEFPRVKMLTLYEFTS